MLVFLATVFINISFSISIWRVGVQNENADEIFPLSSLSYYYDSTKIEKFQKRKI